MRRPHDIALSFSHSVGRQIRGRMKRRSPGRAIAVSIRPLQRDPSRRRTFNPFRRSTQLKCWSSLQRISSSPFELAGRSCRTDSPLSGGMIGVATPRPHAFASIGGPQPVCRRSTHTDAHSREAVAEHRLHWQQALRDAAELASSISRHRRSTSPASDFLVRPCDRQFRQRSTGPSHLHPVRGCTESAGHSPQRGDFEPAPSFAKDVRTFPVEPRAALQCVTSIQPLPEKFSSFPAGERELTKLTFRTASTLRPVHPNHCDSKVPIDSACRPA